MTWSAWLITAAMLFIVEILTPGAFFFACLSAGALFGALAAFLNLPFGLPYIIFALVSLASIYTIRPIARKLFQKGEIRSNVDALIGQKAWVTEAISPQQPGKVKIEGEIWRAEAKEAIPENTWVEVVSVQGTRLEVKITN